MRFVYIEIEHLSCCDMVVTLRDEETKEVVRTLIQHPLVAGDKFQLHGFTLERSTKQ